jgi:hypothetical protein
VSYRVTVSHVRFPFIRRQPNSQRGFSGQDGLRHFNDSLEPPGLLFEPDTSIHAYDNADLHLTALRLVSSGIVSHPHSLNNRAHVTRRLFGGYSEER